MRFAWIKHNNKLTFIQLFLSARQIIWIHCLAFTISLFCTWRTWGTEVKLLMITQLIGRTTTTHRSSRVLTFTQYAQIENAHEMNQFLKPFSFHFKILELFSYSESWSSFPWFISIVSLIQPSSSFTVFSAKIGQLDLLKHKNISHIVSLHFSNFVMAALITKSTKPSPLGQS